MELGHRIIFHITSLSSLNDRHILYFDLFLLLNCYKVSDFNYRTASILFGMEKGQLIFKENLLHTEKMIT